MPKNLPKKLSEISKENSGIKKEKKKNSDFSDKHIEPDWSRIDKILIFIYLMHWDCFNEDENSNPIACDLYNVCNARFWIVCFK